MMNNHWRNILKFFLSMVFGFLIIALIALVSPSHGAISPYQALQDEPGAVYIVQKGDTLYQLAKRYWGDGKLYPQLAEFNGIKNPHLIHPGQTIWLTEPLTEMEKIEVAEQVIWKKMVKTFKVVHGQTFDSPMDSRIWALWPLELIEEEMATPQIKDLFKETAIRLEWTDLTVIHRSIMDEAGTAKDALLLASLIGHESNFRNISGSYAPKCQEIGPGQVMPGTALQIVRRIPALPNITLKEVSTMLWSIRTNIWVAWVHFKGLLDRTGGKVYDALRKYNGHGESTVVYANAVMAKFKRYTNQYNTELYKTTLAKIEGGLSDDSL